MLSPLLWHERRILHHRERRSIAVLHIALRWIGDLNQVLEGMNSLPFAFAGRTGHGLRRVAAFRTNRHAPVPHVIDVAVHGADHDVLRHVLQTRKRLLGLREVVGGGQPPCRVDQLVFVGVRDRERISLAVLMRDDWPVMSRFDLEILRFHFTSDIDADSLGSNSRGRHSSLNLYLPSKTSSS
jgi:hypothetical protein